MADMTAHEKYRAIVKAKHKSCTPYRLGLAVGVAGDNLPSPYPPGSHGARLYGDGVRYGRDARRRGVALFVVKDPA